MKKIKSLILIILAFALAMTMMLSLELVASAKVNPNFTLYIKDGKVYKNSASGTDLTEDVADLGLKYVTETPAHWEMNNFTFNTGAATAIEFADNGTPANPIEINIVIIGTNTITAGSQTSGNTFGIKFSGTNASYTISGTSAEASILNVVSASTANNSCSYGMYSKSKLTFENLTANFAGAYVSSGWSFGIQTSADFTVSDGAKITCTEAGCSVQTSAFRMTSGLLKVDGTGELVAKCINPKTVNPDVDKAAFLPAQADAKAFATGTETALVWDGTLKTYKEDTVVSSDITFKSIYDITDCTVSEIASQTFSAVQIMPELTVQFGNVTLVKGTDYIVSYGENLNVGTDAGTVTLKGIGKYYGTLEITFDIIPATITISDINVSDKEYDGTTTATVTYTSAGVISETDVKVNCTADFYDSAEENKDKNVGTDKTVKISFSLSGSDKDNFVLDTEDTTATASITAKALVISDSIVDNKTYDGNAVANVTAGDVSGIIVGDDVTVVAAGTFEDKNVGENKNVSVTYTLSGADKDNYTAQNETFTATISSRTITVTGSVADGKVYDGTTDATVYIGTVEGIIPGDDAEVEIASGTFSGKNVGNGLDVTIVYTITGADAGNYTISNSTTPADIEKRSVTLTSGSDSKSYDGTPLTNENVAIEGFGFVEGEGATYAVNGSQTDAGTSDNTFEYTLNSNTLSNNYTITSVYGTLEVTPGELTITVSDYNGTYDGDPHGSDVTVSWTEGTEISYSTDGGVTWQAEAPVITDPGTVEVTVKAENPNFETETSTYTLTVEKDDSNPITGEIGTIMVAVSGLIIALMACVVLRKKKAGN